MQVGPNTTITAYAEWERCCCVNYTIASDNQPGAHASAHVIHVHHALTPPTKATLNFLCAHYLLVAIIQGGQLLFELIEYLQYFIITVHVHHNNPPCTVILRV